MNFQGLERWRLGGWIGLVGVWITSFVYMGTTVSETVFCVFRRITERSCPGCGLTRSFCAMSGFDPGAAFTAHLAGPILYMAMVWVIVTGALRVAFDRPQAGALPKWIIRAYWGIAAGRRARSKICLFAQISFPKTTVAYRGKVTF